jgi:hypothetical protein
MSPRAPAAVLTVNLVSASSPLVVSGPRRIAYKGGRGHIVKPRSTSAILGTRTVFVNNIKRSISPRAVAVKVGKKKGKDALDGKENSTTKVPTLT